MPDREVSLMSVRAEATPNTLLTGARQRTPSPSGSGRAMSRQELADAINAYLFARYQMRCALDETYVGKLERGEHRWPNAKYREAFRATLHTHDDAELGFYIVRAASAPPSALVAGGRRPPSHARVALGATGDERARELYVRGYGLLGANDRRGIETAEALLERAVDRDPGFARAIAVRGYTRWRKYFAGWATSSDALKSAFGDVDAALDADPDSALAHVTFVRACWDMGWHERALAAGRSIYDKHPDSLDATIAFARGLTNAGLAREALPLVGAVLSEDPTDAAAQKLRIWCALLLGDHTSMVEISRTYLSQHPADANTRWAVALASQYLPGGAPEAIRLAQEALAADPGDLTVWTLLGYLHRLSGSEKHAQDAWSDGLSSLSSIESSAANPRMGAWIANLHAALGDRVTAMRITHDLADSEPQNGYIKYRLAHVLAEVGQLTAAVRMLDSAVNNGFLSIQLLQQEEVLGLAPVRRVTDYIAVVRRLEAEVGRCRRAYATHLPKAFGGPNIPNEETPGDPGKK